MNWRKVIADLSSPVWKLSLPISAYEIEWPDSNATIRLYSLSRIQIDGTIHGSGSAQHPWTCRCAMVKTPKYVYVFEFKLNGTAEEAMKQIDEKGYLIPYQKDHREIIKIGVEFSAANSQYRSSAGRGEVNMIKHFGKNRSYELPEIKTDTIENKHLLSSFGNKCFSI